jgi:hypothetical protein
MKETGAGSFDVGAMLRELAAGESSEVPAWLEASCRTPKPFFQALHAHVRDSGQEPLKSQPFEAYDFYNDLVVRHLRRGSDALVSPAAGEGWRRLSYPALHTRVSALAAAWESAGVKAGQCVALVLPVDEQYGVALLTALRLGLVFSTLPPSGASFVRTRLGALAPAYVVSHSRHVPLLGEGPWKPLPLSPPPGLSREPPQRSHTWPAQAPVARLFSPLSPTPEQPVTVSASTLFLGLLRDAVLVLALRPEDRVAMPGFEPQQHQPWALLVTLLAGGCFLEAPEEALTGEDPKALPPPTVVGVSPALRERLLQGQGRTEGWRLWVRNLAEPYDWEHWARLEARLATQPRLRGMGLVANTALGGSLVFSKPLARPSPLATPPGSRTEADALALKLLHQEQPSPFAVLPAPGQPWELADVLGNGQPSRADGGLYAAKGKGLTEASFGRFLLGRTRTGYFFSGSLRLGAHGQTYPEREVVQVVEKHPEVTGAAVVITPASQQLNRARVVLLVFTPPEGPAGELQAGLERLIDLELGARYRPEQMCFYPLMPRRTEEGAVDADWCRGQFLGGNLDRKSKDALFLKLSQVCWLLSEARAAQGDGA